jgi:L-ascorbate metabolism protein UlaG (beta-lactamase superfamily)
MNEYMKKIREREVPRGTAALWWMGQMGLLVKIGGTVLCVDYFATETPDRQVPPPVPAAETEGVDAFLGTHDHLDHIDHEAWRIWNRCCPKAKFVFPALCRGAVYGDGIPADRCIGLTDGESCRIGDVTVRAIAAAHEFLNRDPETGLYPCLQYIIEGDGVRIYHAGDTLRYEGMLPKLQAMGRIDAAILPINGRDGVRYRNNLIGNMTFQEAADLAGEVKAGTVIPGHWDMFAENLGDPEAFTDYFGAKYPGQARVVKPRYMEPMEISGRV